MENNSRKNEKIAVALKYSPGENVAPEIVATGKNNMADKILNLAKDADVPTYKDDKLAKTLSKLEVGDMIPPELYKVVAEILVYVDKADKIKSRIK